MSVTEFTQAAGPWGRSAMTALLIFVALWFDPRITYMQRDIVDNRTYIADVDKLGTRKSQEEVATLSGKVNENTRRIQELELQYKHIDETLTQILQRLAGEKR